MTDWHTTLAALAQPFPETAIKWRAGATTKDKTKAQALPYVDPRDYERRLDEVCPGQWHVAFLPWGDNKVICNLSIAGITRASTGESSSDDFAPGTSAEAQAFKRACSKFGLGRYLYDLPSPWMDYDGKKLLATPTLPRQHRATTPQTASHQQTNYQAHDANHDSYPANEETLSRERAQAMHRELGKLGFKTEMHYVHAEHVTGKRIKSLTQLTDSEARGVYAFMQREAERLQAHGMRPYVSDEEAEALIN
jgi:hypothetical protein